MARVQEKIRSYPVPNMLVDSILYEIYENKNSPIYLKKGVPRIRLRSSTNAEDLDGFTGAGLYDSFGVSLFEKDDLGFYDFSKPKPVEKVRKKLIKALQGIFAAVWNTRAFMEREWFSINGRQHLDIAMGVAIHPAFPGKKFNGEFGELANGVAVTDHPYKNDDPYVVYLNSQHLDLAVTNPPTEEELLEYEIDPSADYKTEVTLVNSTPDVTGQTNFWNQWRNWTYEIRSRSSIFDGQVVLVDQPKEKNNLTFMEIRRLSQAIQEIRYAFAQVYGKPFEQFKVDVEWKVYGDSRELFIKQARPFN